MGRNTYWPMRWGARGGVAFDFDTRSVARAKENLREFPLTRVEYMSVYDAPWKNEFDVAFSIGVIHHLEDPERALYRMTEGLVPGGELLVWVYGYEGNEWIVRFIDPIRINITSKLPVGLVHFLSYFCSIPLYLFVKIFRGPTGYLKQIAGFDFWHIHSIVFDQLIPDIAHYWKREEVRALVEGLPLTQVKVIAPPNGSGWILSGTKTIA
jgi:SAM-dependent methyltransferase